MAALITHTATTITPPITVDEEFGYERSETDIPKQAYEMATYYIPYQLRQAVDHEKLRGLPKNYVIPPSQPSDLDLAIACQCTKIESQYADFFTNLPSTLNLEVENAQILFMQISKQVFDDGTKNWGRVVTVFALAATFAVHFAKKGNLHVIPKIPKWVRQFVEQYLVDWISEQGGWDDLPKTLNCNLKPSWSRVLAYGGFMAAAGYLLVSTSLR